jgi:hypothetical protein
MCYVQQQHQKELEREQDFKNQREAYERKHDAQMTHMYERLEKQMKELKATSVGASSSKGVETELRNQLFISKQQLETLKHENTQMRSALLQQPHGAAAAGTNGSKGGQDSQQSSERVRELEKYVKQLELGADKGLLFQVQ